MPICDVIINEISQQGNYCFFIPSSLSIDCLELLSDSLPQQENPELIKILPCTTEVYAYYFMGVAIFKCQDVY